MSAAALIGVAGFVVGLEPAPHEDRREPAARRGPLVASSPGMPGSGIARRRPAVVRAQIRSDSLAGARTSAGTFVRAFLRYQAGDTSSRTSSLLARSASTRLHRFLVANPVRRSREAPRSEIRSILLYAVRPAEAKASALLRYGRRRGLLEFLLERGKDGWRVTELYP